MKFTSKIIDSAKVEFCKCINFVHILTSLNFYDPTSLFFFSNIKKNACSPGLTCIN